MTASGDGSFASSQHFQDKAAEYERASGGSTSSIAARLAASSGRIDENSHILDLATGPGVVIDALLDFPMTEDGARLAKYTVVEPAASMLDIVRYKAESKWPIDPDRISIHNLSAEDLQENKAFPEDSFTHVFCNFGFMFFPDPESAAKSIHRVLKPAGKAFISTFTHVGYWPAVKRASAVIHPEGPAFQPPYPVDWTDEAHLSNVLRNGGFQIIESSLVECQMKLASLQELARNTARRFHGIFQQLGWTEADLQKLPAILETELAQDTENIAIEADSMQVRMISNVVICTKDQQR